MPALDLRLRNPSPDLLALPWRVPLAEWDPTTVPFRDVPVGPSRHLVRFVEADGRLWALKDLPRRVALHEYEALRVIEGRQLAAVRAAGVVLQPSDQAAILVTHYLERSWQYRRLLMRVPWTMTAHRGRLFDAMAALLVDLHRNGIYWGDCSLANTLFMRDGQSIQAWMVDAETAEFHPSLTGGQRRLDLDIMVENVAGGLLDVPARREEPPEAVTAVIDEAHGLVDRYEKLWELLHDEPVVALADRSGIGSRVQRLNEAGFAVDELRLEAADDDGGDAVRVKVAVAGRRFHADRLRALTGLAVGEGQATILLNDLHAHQARMALELGHAVPEDTAARNWLLHVLTPGIERAHAAVDGRGDPTQAYCDLLEVRWLLSERQGYDVGDEPALHALAERTTPGGSAADLAFVDTPTTEVPAVTAQLSEDDPGPGP
jgi:hypothetical protein